MKTKWICLFPYLILTWSWTNPAFPDTIRLTDGSKVDGRILNSAVRYVNIRKDDGRSVQILHGKIESITFTWADMVYLESGEKLKCKIVKRIEPNLHIVSSGGKRELPLDNIKMYYYHAAQQLKIPELPETGPEFKNDNPFPPKDLAHSLYLGIHGGAHWAPYTDWKKDFMSAVWQYSGGIKAGFYLTGKISIGGGIALDAYSFTHYENLDSRIKSLFYYGGIEYAVRIGRKPEAYGFIGINAGLFQTTGTSYLYSYREIDMTSKNIAYMPRIGARTFFGRNLSLDVEAGYLFGKSGAIETGPENDLTVEFSGFSTFLSIVGYF